MNKDTLNKELLKEAEEFYPQFKEVVRYVMEKGGVYLDYIERKFKIGFNRVGRIIDYMYSLNFLERGDGENIKVLITPQEFEVIFGE